MPGPHRQEWVLNTHGGSLRFLVGCTCGDAPTTAPARRGGAEVRWHDRHRAAHALSPQLDGTPVFGPGAAAAGLTWDEWRAAGNTTDPWTGEPR